MSCTDNYCGLERRQSIQYSIHLQSMKAIIVQFHNSKRKQRMINMNDTRNSGLGSESNIVFSVSLVSKHRSGTAINIVLLRISYDIIVLLGIPQ